MYKNKKKTKKKGEKKREKKIEGENSQPTFPLSSSLLFLSSSSFSSSNYLHCFNFLCCKFIHCPQAPQILSPMKLTNLLTEPFCSSSTLSPPSTPPLLLLLSTTDSDSVDSVLPSELTTNSFRVNSAGCLFVPLLFLFSFLPPLLFFLPPF